MTEINNDTTPSTESNATSALPTPSQKHEPKLKTARERLPSLGAVASDLLDEAKRVLNVNEMDAFA